MRHTIEAVLAVHLCQAHMSVLLTKESDSVQDSPTLISIPMKCYLFGMKRKVSGNTQILKLRNN